MGDILEDYLRIKAEYDASTGSFSRDVNAESAQAATPTWANQDPDPTYDDPEEQAVMSSRKRYPENPTLDLYSRFVAEKEIRDLREQKSAAIGQKNLEARNPFMRGLYRGFDTLQGTYQGGLGMLSSLAKDETSAQQRFQAYQDEMRQASENPRDNIDFFSTDPETGAFGSLSNFGTYAAGTLGEAIPSLAESVLTGIAGAALGAAVVPAPDPFDVATVPAGAVGGVLAKGAIKKAISNAAAEYVKRGVAAEAAEGLARQYVGREVAKRVGSTAATAAVTGLHEGGGMYMEGREAGYDSPGTALGLGLASGLSESLLGTAPGVLKSFAGRSGVDEIARREGWRAAAGYLWDTVKASGEEGVQEGFQEFLGSLNKEINDPNSDLFNKENFMQWAEAAAGGALVGGTVKSGTTGVELVGLRGGRGGRRGADPFADPFLPQLPPGADTSEDLSNVQAKRELLERVVDEVNAGQRETFPRELAKNLGLIGPKEKSTSDSRLQRAEAEIARLRELENNLLAPPAQESTAQPPAKRIPPVAPPPPPSDAFEQPTAPGTPPQQRSTPAVREKRTRTDYQINTEDAGAMNTAVFRMEDGSVAIMADGFNPIEYNSAFAKDKSDEELLASAFEPLGFLGVNLNEPPQQPPVDPSNEEALVNNQELARQTAVEMERMRSETSQPAVPPSDQPQAPVAQPEAIPPSPDPFDAATNPQLPPAAEADPFNVPVRQEPSTAQVQQPQSSMLASDLIDSQEPTVDAQTDTTPVPAVRSPEDHAAVPMFGVYETPFRGERKFFVKEFENRGAGDAMFDSLDEANKHSAIVARRNEEKVARQQKAKADEELAVKKQRDHEASFGGFLSADPKTKARQLKVLDSSRTYRGKVVTVKELIEQKVADGAVVNSEGQLESPDGAYLGSDKLTKFGIDYARHLIGSKPSDAVSAESQGEEVSDAQGTRKGGGPNVEVQTEGGQRPSEGQVSPQGEQAADETPSPVSSQVSSTPVAEQAATSPADASKAPAKKKKKQPKSEAKQEEKESPVKTYLSGLADEDRKDLAEALGVKNTVDEIFDKLNSQPTIRDYLETAAAEVTPRGKKKRQAAPRGESDADTSLPKKPEGKEIPSEDFTEDERKQEQILKKIGITLRLVEGGPDQGVPGLFIPESRTIWLDRNYSQELDKDWKEKGRPEKAMTWGLFAHEMFHAIKRSSPKTWRSLYNWVSENDSVGLGKAKVAYLADMKKVDTGYYESLLEDEDLLNDEGLSRYLEDRAAYFKFWNDLGKAKPGLLARIGRWVRRVLRFAEPGATNPNTLAGQTRQAIERAMKRHNVAMKGKGGRRAAPARTGKQTKIAVRGERRVVRGMTPQQVDDLDRIIKKQKFSPEDAAELEKLALDKLERFPTTGTGEEPWSEAEIKKAGFIKSPKTGKRKPFISFAGQPYTFQLNPETGKAFTKKKDDPAKRAQYVAKMGDRLVEIVDEITSEAEKGQEWAKEILRHKTWYSAMTRALRKHYVNADLFADLLGALSPITKVKDNWNFALDAIGSFVRGDYDVALKAFSEHLNSGGTVSNYEGPLALREVTYVVEKEKTLNAIISKKFDIKTSKDLAEYRKLLTEANPEVLRRGRKLKEGDVLLLPMKFGTNTKNAMKAMLDLWRILEPGQAPKAKQFSANIIGASHGATIDVWAARLLQRIARQLYGGNLRIPILAEMGVQGVLGPDLKAGGAFGMGQDIFAHAAEKLGMNPDDLQAVVWFYEKRHWTEKNWTSEEGEGGSLDDQHQELDPDRYIVGGTVERPDFKPTASQLREAFAGAWKTLVGNTDVLIAKAEPTLGRYSYFDNDKLVKVDERSMDFEFTVKPEFSPAEVLSEVARIAQESGQDAVLVSRVLDDSSDSENARPGVELAFSRPATEDEVKAIIDEINKTMPETGFTFVVDPRHAGSDIPKQFVGLRFQYVPEFDSSNRTEKMTAVLDNLAYNLLVQNPELVRAAQLNYYDSVLLTKENYDDYRAGTAETAFGRSGGKRSGRRASNEATTGADRSGGSVSESDSGTALPSGSDTDVEGRDSGQRASPRREQALEGARRGVDGGALGGGLRSRGGKNDGGNGLDQAQEKFNKEHGLDSSTPSLVAVYENPAGPVLELNPRYSAEIYHKTLDKLRSSHPAGIQVSLKNVDDYRGFRLFMAEDGTAVAALNGQDMVSLASGKNASGSSMGSEILYTLIEQGGRTGDAYGSFLPKLYARFGFQPVARLGWSDDIWKEYADAEVAAGRFTAESVDPKALFKAWGGKVDYYFVAYTGDTTPFDTLDKALVEKVPLVEDWDAGLEAQQRALRDVAQKKAKENRDEAEKVSKRSGERFGVARRTEMEGRRGETGYDSRSQAPLADAPRKQGATGPDPKVVQAAERYARSVGIELKRQATYVAVDEKFAKRIAKAYEEMANDPFDPKVVEAYRELYLQTTSQYQALVDEGFSFYFYDGKNDPYADKKGGFSNPYNAIRELRTNQRMAVFPTSLGFGDKLKGDDYDVKKTPSLASTGIMWPWGSPDGPLRPVLANDLFRAVHDTFGHSMEGAGFRARGEENAWQAHVRLFYGAAVGAMTSSTRGQNSWLNFGPYGEKNQTAKVEDTVFAEQKIGLMPEWTWTEGRAADMEETGDEGVRYSPGRQAKRKRDPEVTKAAQDLKAGLIDRDQYQRIVDMRMPLRKFDEVPTPASREDMIRGLANYKAGTRLKRDLVQNPEAIAAGMVLESRLDIPAYENEDVWVVTLHQPRPNIKKGTAAKVVAFTPTAVLKNVTFGVTENAALNIAAGKPKATIATMRGEYVPMTAKQAYKLAETNKDRWVEIGMNPIRHTYFYDKDTQTPVVSAEEVVQVGGMVLAKNPKPGQRDAYRYGVRRQSPKPPAAIADTLSQKTDAEVMSEYKQKWKSNPSRGPFLRVIRNQVPSQQDSVAVWEDDRAARLFLDAIDSSPVVGNVLYRGTSSKEIDRFVEDPEVQELPRGFSTDKRVAKKFSDGAVIVVEPGARGMRIGGTTENEVIVRGPFDVVSDEIRSGTRVLRVRQPSSVRYSPSRKDEKAYMDAVKSGDMKTAQKMVDDAIEKAGEFAGGVSPVVYHGSPHADFYEFQIPSKGFNSTVFGSYEVSRNAAFFTADKEVASRYQSQGGRNGGSVRKFSVFGEMLDLRNGISDAQFNTLVENGVNSRWLSRTGASWELFDKEQDPDGTLVKVLQKMGYDGAIIKDTDGESDFESYVAFSPSQIKSADPVTYDDAGNVIPLGERFNDLRSDIRYSPSRRKKGDTLAGLYKFLEKEGLIKPQSQRTPSGEGETTGTKNVKTNELRAMLGLGDRVMPPRESEEQWQQEAARLIAKDSGYPARLAEELRVDPRPITPVEEAVLNRHIRELANRRMSKDVVDDVLTAVEASEQVGRIWGQTGRSRQIELESDFSIAGIIRRHLREVQQRPTEEQLQEYAELAERYKKLEEDNKKLVEELAKETIARKKAEAAAQTEPEKPKLGTKRASVVKKVADAFSVFQNLWSGGNRPAASRNLRPQTETPEFKKWFGDSKVVDADGKPMVVYHGTGDQFTEFDLDHRNRKDTGWLGTGVYVTTSQDIANSYANLKPGSSSVMPLFVKVEKPYIATLKDKQRIQLISHSQGNEAGRQAANDWTQKLKSDGYDGVILEYPESLVGKSQASKEIVVFDTRSVKSATGNQGTFDATNPDIRYAPSRQPNDIKAAANNVVSALREAGVSSILELESQIKANLPDASPEQIQAIRDAWNESIAKNKPESPIGDNPTDPELGARAKELMRAAIELGYGAEKEDWMDVVDVVYEQLSNEVPGISKYETMQAMSDYGAWQSLNTEPVEVIIRAIRGKTRQSLKIEDTIAAIKQSEEWLREGVSPEEVARRLRDKGLLPKATGQERATPDSIERDLISQFNKLKKTLPVPAESKEGQLKSALTTAKTAANNRLEILDKDIAALDEAIKNRKELVKPVAEKTSLEPDEELASLREQLEQKRRIRDKLKADYEKIFPPTKPKQGRKPLTEEQRLDASVRMLERQISAVKADVKALEDGTWAPAAKNPELTSERKEELMSELRSLRQLRKVALEANPVYQATEELKYWQRYRKSQERRLAFWQRRLEEAKVGRIPVPLKKRTITEKAILEKNMEIEEVQYDAMIAIEKAKRATWNTGQWIGQGLLEATSLIPKTLMLGMEMSFVLRQGFFYTYSQPMKSFYALMEAIPAVFSQRLALESADGLKNRPNAKEYELAKVDFTQVTGPQAKLEELYQSAIIRWLENTETKLLLPLRTWAKVYAMAERGNRTFSNIMKADMYDIQKRDTLAAREFFGVNTGWTEDDIKETGRIANIFSGRGTGLKGGNPWLDWLFLARRWTWSRIQADFIVPFQLVTPQWIGQWNADRGMRVALAKLYIQAMVGHTAKMAAAYVAYRLLAGDDEEEMPTFEFDLRSSDALAMKIGETRFKDEGGLMPAVVLASRILTGKMKTSEGEIKSIYGDDVQYGGKTAADFIINYGRYKLGTAPSAILEWASGRDAVGNVIADKDDPTAIYRNIVGSRITPLTYREIYAAESELGLKRGTLAAMEAFFGVSVSTHGSRSKYKQASEEDRKKQFEKDLEAMEYNTPDFGYKDLLTDKQVKQMFDQREAKKQAVVYAALANPQKKTHRSDESFQKSVAERDKAVEKFREMGLDFNDARLMLLNYYKRQYGSAYEMRGKTYVLRDSYVQRLRQLRKILSAK